MANCELKVQCIREGRARPIAALRVRFAQATRRLRRGRILRDRDRTDRTDARERVPPVRNDCGRNLVRHGRHNCMKRGLLI